MYSACLLGRGQEVSQVKSYESWRACFCGSHETRCILYRLGVSIPTDLIYVVTRLPRHTCTFLSGNNALCTPTSRSCIHRPAHNHLPCFRSCMMRHECLFRHSRRSQASQSVDSLSALPALPCNGCSTLAPGAAPSHAGCTLLRDSVQDDRECRRSTNTMRQCRHAV